MKLNQLETSSQSGELIWSLTNKQKKKHNKVGEKRQQSEPTRATRQITMIQLQIRFRISASPRNEATETNKNVKVEKEI